MHRDIHTTSVALAKPPARNTPLSDVDIVRRYGNVLLLGPDGESHGNTASAKALMMARSQKQNLVIVSKSSGVQGVPVARIMSLAKLQAAENKKKRQQRLQASRTQLKELRC